MSKFLKSALILFMALLISNIPRIASAEIAKEMITTAEVVEVMTREQAEANVLAQIEREDVSSELKKLGITTEEVTNRMASLSDSELQDLSKQMNAAQYGGAIVGILVIVVLVLLIIFLAKRV